MRGDGMSHGHRLSRPGDAEQRLEAVASCEAGGQLRNRGGLIAGGLEWRLESELGARGHPVKTTVFVR
jgi:hypothetical protein